MAEPGLSCKASFDPTTVYLIIVQRVTWLECNLVNEQVYETFFIS